MYQCQSLAYIEAVGHGNGYIPDIFPFVAACYNVTFITDETRAARNGEPAHKYQSWKRSCGQGFVNFYGGMYK